MMITTPMKQTELTPLWKALADPKRRRIVQLLAEKTRTTSEISASFDVSRFAIMRHLKVLEKAGLIDTKREGRQRWNFLNEDLFQRIQHSYLGGGADGSYRLQEILSFLTRQEANALSDPDASERASIEMEATFQATPDRVFQSLTNEIDAWWSYRVSDDSRMYLEPQVGGRLYEAFKGGGMLYALVTFLKEGEEIRMSGPMGLVDNDSNSIINFTLQADSSGATRLWLSHRFLGSVNALVVDTFKRSWIELLTLHLKSLVEEGIQYRARVETAT
jgi:DNA-binding transcriptional ArsR family regulator